MQQAHKQRIVGATVLLALGLIFIPMVLDFSQEDRVRIKNAEIPPAPDTMKMEVLPLDVWSQKIDPQVNRDTRIIEAPQKTKPAPQEKPAAKEARVNTETPKPAVAPEAKVVIQKPEAEPEKPPPGGTTAWVVQVASLSVEKKAFELRDTLRKAGHPAFVEQVNTAKGIVFRVKAGPVLEHGKAEKMKNEIKRATKLNGLVMLHR